MRMSMLLCMYTRHVRFMGSIGRAWGGWVVRGLFAQFRCVGFGALLTTPAHRGAPPPAARAPAPQSSAIFLCVGHVWQTGGATAPAVNVAPTSPPSLTSPANGRHFSPVAFLGPNHGAGPGGTPRRGCGATASAVSFFVPRACALCPGCWWTVGCCSSWGIGWARKCLEQCPSFLRPRNHRAPSRDVCINALPSLCVLACLPLSAEHWVHATWKRRAMVVGILLVVVLVILAGSLAAPGSRSHKGPSTVAGNPRPHALTRPGPCMHSSVPCMWHRRKKLTSST